MLRKEQNLTCNLNRNISSILMIHMCLHICSHQHWWSLHCKKKHNKKT